MQFSLNVVNVVLEKSLNLIFTSGQEPCVELLLSYG